MATFSATTWQKNYWEPLFEITDGDYLDTLFNTLDSLEIASINVENSSTVSGTLNAGGTFTFRGTNLTSNNINNVNFTQIAINQGSSLNVDIQGNFNLEGGEINYLLLSSPDSYRESVGRIISDADNVTSFITEQTFRANGATGATIEFIGDGAGNYTQLTITDGSNSFVSQGLFDITTIDNADNRIEAWLTGNDVLTGTTGDDYLKGLAGNDQLNGGAGLDTVKNA